MNTYSEMAMRFVKDVEALKLNSEYLHPEYEQIEFPNLLNPKGQTSNFNESLARLETAKKILKKQNYNITSLLEKSDFVVMESHWTGELVDGRTLKAFFCMIFEFKERKIYRIRNYDCFESL